MFDSTAGEGGAPALLAGKYRLEREVGRGGMGVVYQATHTALRLRVAIKVVLPELAQNPLVIARVLREARCAAQITGDHVVRVIDVGQLDSGQPFIVMEYVEGEDLARRLGRSGPLPLHAAVHALLEACIAIAEAHAKAIVHRDLKPSNLFLARAADGRELIKVLDFGISKQADGERPVTRPSDVMGSPNYMAPEQICAPLAVDARADLWALGAILIELATGKRAFPGDSLTAVYSRVLTGEPELPDPDSGELPAELVSVVSRCLRKDPSERFQSVHELVAALAPFAPPASAAALRAIARFEHTVLGASAASPTATNRPSPLGSSPPATSPSRHLGPLGRSPALIAAGIGLGLALSAAVAAGAGALGPNWRAGQAMPASLPERASQPAGAASFRPGMPAPSAAVASALVASALVAPAAPSAADAGEPEVRVLGAAALPPRAGSDAATRESAAAPEMPGGAPDGSERPLPEPEPLPKRATPEPGRAAELERGPASSSTPPAPLRNAWDVTTFGGRS